MNRVIDVGRVADIPSDILEAAHKVSHWFSERNIDCWQLGGIEVRDYTARRKEYFAKRRNNNAKT